MEYKPKYDPMLPPDNWEDFDLEFFTSEKEPEIMTLSMGQEKNEVLQYYNVEYDKLEANDQFFFDCCFNRARALGRSRAVQNLFDSMKGKGGHNAALEYLVRFGEKWPDKEGDAGARGRTFKLVMD